MNPSHRFHKIINRTQRHALAFMLMPPFRYKGLIWYSMLMDFNAAEYIYTPRFQHIRLGLFRMQVLMKKLGHPENTLRCVHIAGTNGKGSTCSYLSSILQVAGYKTAMFTSPHLESFEERMRINNIPISQNDLRSCTLKVKEAADEVEKETGEHPTEFELLTAVALVYFAQQKPDICVIEVGLGGLLDATNVISPSLCIITPISIDHTGYLGNSIEEIAAEKAGIIKENIPVIVGIQKPEVKKLLATSACAKNARHIFIHKDDLQVFPLGDTPSNKTPFCATFRQFSYRNTIFETSLLAIYQPENAAIAIEGARELSNQGWSISEDHIHEGIKGATWPGRFEIISSHPFVVVDGAHNKEGADKLYSSLEELLGKERSNISIVFGSLEDKETLEMIKPFTTLCQSFYTYAPNSPRARSAEDSASLITTINPNVSASSYADATSAMKAALNATTPESAVIAFGSLYSIADIKRCVKETIT